MTVPVLNDAIAWHSHPNRSWMRLAKFARRATEVAAGQHRQLLF